MKKSDLRDASSIPEWLGDIVRNIVGDKVRLFVHKDFNELVSLSEMTRNDLHDAIRSKLASLRTEYLGKGRCYDEMALDVLLQLSSIFASENAIGYRRDAIGIIARYMGKTLHENILPPLDNNERNIWELPFKHLVENLMFKISNEDAVWMKEHDEFVLSLHTTLSSWTEYYDRNKKVGLCVKYGAFPNMNSEPYRVEELQRGIDIPQVLFEMYNEVIGVPLEAELVDSRFETFYDFDVIEAKDVAKIIEDELGQDGFKHNMVLDIIRNLDKDDIWAKWFPRIAEKKAELFLSQVQSDCKDSVFELMKINDSDKLHELVNLAKEDDFEEIISRGLSAIVERRNKEADFNFKYSLGNYVEQMIRLQLAEALDSQNNDLPNISVETGCDREGCDIMVLADGECVYCIEVKSRWGTDQSVQMSPYQMRTSIEEAERYALCCVDMTHLGNQTEEHVYPSVEEALPYIKVITDIGRLCSPFAKISNGDGSEFVYIGGDYKCIVPQSTIKSHGKSILDLIAIILEKIRTTNP